MPINVKDLGPVREDTLVGPAVDEWNARKEENNNQEACTRDFRKNFEGLKASLQDDLAQIVTQI